MRPFAKTGCYIRLQKDLIDHVFDQDKVIVQTFIDLKQGGPVRFDEMSEALFVWAKELIAST